MARVSVIRVDELYPMASWSGRGLSSTYQYYKKSTARYLVNGEIPDVSFEIGEQYSGLMPLQQEPYSKESDGKMFFWFSPTVNPAGKDDVVIWLNGGPGCSSLGGFLQENGPIAWKYGTYSPVPNAWSWHKLANVVWVEYPIGTGFSTGKITITNNDEAAEQFLAFWKNLVDKFGLHNKRVFISGESYAGIHVPYVGAAMLKKKNKKYFNVKGALMYDPVMPYSNDLGFDHAAFPAFHRYWENLFAIPDETKKVLEQDNKKCGLDRYLEKHLAYPPPARPWPKVQIEGCDIVAHFDQVAGAINPCFNPYLISNTCPVLWDVLGYPSIAYTPPNATVWFNKPDVRKAIHAPQSHPEWKACQGPVFAGSGSDNYDGSQHEKRFQTLVQRTNNVLVGSGLADMIIQPNVTALNIQMTRWNGKQGFQDPPSRDLLLPKFTNGDKNVPNWAGGNVQGKIHTERGLTHSTVTTAGHMVPQNAPAAAFRHLEFVLGRIKSLSAGTSFSIKISTSFEWPF
ncbi:hypothetical protein ACHAPJ_011424 [Fusarium lateritium]